MTHDYTLCTTTGYLKGTEISALLDAAVPLQAAHIQSIRNLMRDGCRYSNQDFDVLAAAHNAQGKSQIDEWNRCWVEKMNEEVKAR
jgi:hypothetical protein